MLEFLKNHPFAVEAHFNSSIVLTFAVPKEEIEHLIPPCLTLDTFKDTWAFIAVAMVSTKELRPKGFPKCMGNSFFLIGYRIFVRYRNLEGKNLRGLFILKSETNKKKMQYLGNIFTKYKYTTTDILETYQKNRTTISSVQSDFKLSVDVSKKDASLPKNSPFTNWKEARRFAGPLPFSFTYDAAKKEVLIIEGVRQHWIPQALEVIDCEFSFIKNMDIDNCVLANAFVIENIPYYWKKGKKELWNN